MKLVLSVFLLVSSTLVLAQSRQEILENYMRERNKMMEEVLKMFNEDFDTGIDSDFFNDSNVDSFFRENSFSQDSGGVSVEQKYENDGAIVINITPKNENTNFDINVENQMIKITSTSKVEETKNDQNGNFKSFSSSSFSKSIGIPKGYTAQAPKQKNNSVIIKLVPGKEIKNLKLKNNNIKSEEKKVPVGPREGADII